MKKNKTIAYLLALFPFTGFFGVHQLYLMNFKKFFIRLLAACTIIGGVIFWFYDIVNLSNMINEKNNQREEELDHIINLLDHGKLKEALKMFVKTGHTQIYVKEIIKRGRGDVIVKHFAKTAEDKKELEKLISKGDTESLVIHLSTYYAKTKIEGLLSI